MSQLSSSDQTDPIEAYRIRLDRMVLRIGAVGLVVVLIVALVVGLLVAALARNGLLGAGVALLVLGGLAGWFVSRLRVWHGASLLERLDAQPIDEASHPRLWNLVEGLCLRSGVEVPRLMSVRDTAPNALVIGGDHEQRCLVFTSAALETFDRIELEAVVAWLVSRLRSGEAQSSLRLAGIFDSLPIPGGVVTKMRAGAGIDEMVALHDQAACSLTRYPPGLVGALEHVREAADASSGVVTSSWTVDEAQLWFVPPRVHRVADGPGSDDATDSALDERITRTRDL